VPEAAGRDPAADCGPAVSSRTRHLLHAFLVVFVVTGVAHLELYPFSGFRLFSELRGDERKAWDLQAVDAEGREVAIRLRDLPFGYHETVRLVPEMGDMTQAEREEICEAWSGPLRDRGVDVVGVRIYRTVRSVQSDRAPVERTLEYQCGGGAP
jgi:hypothetical protein